MSPWRSKTPRKLAEALHLPLRTPGQILARHLTRNIRGILNWGARVGWGNIKTINQVGAITIASNKLKTFQCLERAQIPTLEFTKDPAKAAEWLKDHSVICHKDLHGHSGLGLELIKKGAESVPDAEVYTKYFRKKVESRVHIIKQGSGFQTFYLEKKRVLKERYDEFELKEAPSTYIRTYANGWIYAREVKDDPTAIELAKRALSLVGLDFGAVDVMHDGKTYVVGELNTAPGLEGEAFSFYVDNLKQLL